MQSSIFSVVHSEIQDIYNKDSDTFFILYNSFNDLYMAMEQSVVYYYEELTVRIDEKETLELILMLLAFLTNIIVAIILVPVIQHINRQKDDVLDLFCEIQFKQVHKFAKKCEHFMNVIEADEKNKEVDS